jgi:hypothetical protein
VVLSKRTDLPIHAGAIRTQPPHRRGPERALILGWNWRAPAIINELDQYVAAGSQVSVVADAAGAEAELHARCAGLQNQALTFRAGNTTDRELLDALDVGSYDHVITLSYSDTLGVQQADSRTLITLLHLRDIAERTGGRFSIISELLDVRNRNLAEVTQADDIIVSDRMISLVLAQVAENKRLNRIFDDIFNAEGSEIYLKPVEDYVEVGVPLNFYTVLEAAARRNEIAIGYRHKAHSADRTRSYGVVLNPTKSAEITFAADDRIVVIAED